MRAAINSGLEWVAAGVVLAVLGLWTFGLFLGPVAFVLELLGLLKR